MAASSGDKKFYLRYYVGHEGSFGHEFMQFVFHPDGRLRYENSSNYKGPTWIQKEAYVSEAVLAEARRIVEDSEITLEDDSNWPKPDEDGRQELEIYIDGQHVSFALGKLGSLLAVEESKDPEGLRILYYLVQDLRCYVLSLIALHFKIKPHPSV